jgi:purine nucleosidase
MRLLGAVAGLLFLLGSGRASGPPEGTSPPSCPALPRPVILDHDGGIDDFVTLVTLASRPDLLRIIGVTILDADCLAAVALSTTLKLLGLLGLTDVPIAVSMAPGVNPFPDFWRWQGARVDSLPVLNQGGRFAPHPSQAVNATAPELLADLILRSTAPVTIVATGPLTNVAHALTAHGSALSAHIDAVWWMGGAVEVPGNTHPGSVPNGAPNDLSAEWNAYWDPSALGVVWAYSQEDLPLVMVPLDATNQVPITPEFVLQFGPQYHHLYSNLAGTIYATIASWPYETPDMTYFAWDVLTAACLMEEGLCEVDTFVATQATLSGPSQGRTTLLGRHPSADACRAAAVEVHLAEGPKDASVSQARCMAVIRTVNGTDFSGFLLRTLARG